MKVETLFQLTIKSDPPPLCLGYTGLLKSCWANTYTSVKEQITKQRKLSLHFSLPEITQYLLPLVFDFWELLKTSSRVLILLNSKQKYNFMKI